jgi:RNA polymerase sigma-70 factor (ECF subfamily)
MSPQPLSSDRLDPELRVEEHAPAENPSDMALALRMLEDPVAASSELFTRFSADVNRLVWRLLGADPDHNDIVQQVFYKVMHHGRRLRDPARLGAWVQSITVNTVYEELRRRDVRRLFAREADTVELHSDLVRDVESRDLLLRAKAVIDKLPAKERIVFLLHFVEERSLLEVAELCGYSLATAKRRLNAANRRFQVLIARNTDLLLLLKRRQEREK